MMPLQTVRSLCRFEKGPCQRATPEMSLQADLWSRETTLAERVPWKPPHFFISFGFGFTNPKLSYTFTVI